MKTYQQIQQEQEAMIARVGWMVQAVFSSEDSPSFVYTIGLAAKGLPELIVFSLPPQVAMQILNSIAQRMVDGETFALDTPLDEVLEGAQAMLCPAERTQAGKYMFGAARRAPDYRALQLVWPDPKGRWPWDQGYDKNYVQPVLKPVLH